MRRTSVVMDEAALHRQVGGRDSHDIVTTLVSLLSATAATFAAIPPLAQYLTEHRPAGNRVTVGRAVDSHVVATHGNA
jgi:hypothetical protein